MFDAFEADWDILDSVYYCTITATTIGFGDMVPDVKLSSGGGIFKALAVIMYIVFSKYLHFFSIILKTKIKFSSEFNVLKIC